MFADYSHLLLRNTSARHAGIAVADIDGDGTFEFLVAGLHCPNRALKWTGSQLRDIAPPQLAWSELPTCAISAGDFDGDGREELLLLHSGERGECFPDRLMKAIPDGRWIDLLDRPGLRDVQGWSGGRSAAAIDRRGTGRYGFAATARDRPMRLIELAPGNVPADLAPALGLALAAGARGVLAAAVLSHATDLYCLAERNPNALFRNRGDGTFEEVAERLRLDDPDERGRGAVAIDASGTGCLDPMWVNRDGPHRLTARLPNGTFRNRASAGFAFPTGAATAVVADFDNDGCDEAFLHNRGESNRLFRMSAVCGGASGESSGPVMLDPGEALLPIGFGTGAAAADVDGDGVLELLLAHFGADSGCLSLFKVPAARGNGWLRVRPLTRFGAPARGATVRLEAAGRRWAKSIDGGSGYRCQMEPVAHFGLGPSATSPDRVVVVWPDGAEVTVEAPGTNRTLSVAYPRG